jgi:hypothetical protein
MIRIPPLNAYVGPGDFIIARNAEYQNRLIVCQVHEVVSPLSLLVTWLLEDDLLDRLNLNEQCISLLEAKFYNVAKCALKEVTLVSSAQTTIESCNVQSLAFVFHANYFEKNWASCAGMRLAYCTHYVVDDNNNLLLLQHNLHVPFPLIMSGESYPSRMWFSLMQLKEKLNQLLNRRTQNQTCRCSTNIYFALESWDFSCSQFHPTITPFSFSRDCTKPYQYVL